MKSLGRISLLVLPALLAATPATASDPQTWSEYRNRDADITVSYPESWTVLVAVPRADSTAAWSPTVLDPGELHKITFLQGGEIFWPGQYQIRVLANPDSLDLETFYSRFDLSDLWDDSAADTIIAGQAAKTWVRWNYDSLGREYLLINSVGVVHILHDDANGNDPDFAIHRDTYSEMTGTLGPALGFGSDR
jgi:hypothetical protein